MRHGAVAALLLLAGCSQEPEREQPRPHPTLIVRAPDAAALTGAAIPTPELAGATAATGQWSGEAGTAIFGRPGAPVFAIRCAGSMVQAVRYSATGEAMTLATDTGAATYPARPVTGNAAAAMIAPTDSFLDVLLVPRGTLGVRLGDGATLAMPLDARIGAAIRACRRPRG